ncbi:hypothetical protein A7U60_g1243 [Sanghuangporus baumii]|uniref:C2H2-type domain-containing protein n=1 Tax=Sanghuangporus baumii TaxID=108892 RepID=A0A9Q5I4B4_SANBA|nr:hypothetical protein A7U60_g1243 [Sanghuangporus baumii]
MFPFSSRTKAIKDPGRSSTTSAIKMSALASVWGISDHAKVTSDSSIVSLSSNSVFPEHHSTLTYRYVAPRPVYLCVRQMRRFHCSFPGCTHTSLQKSNLKTHYISKHLHLRHHQCNFYGCTKSYSDASALIRHEKLTHGFFRRAHKLYARKTLKKDEVEPELDPELLAFVTATSPLPNYPSADITSCASSASPTTPSSFMMPIPGPPTFDWGNVNEPQALSMDAFLHDMIPEFYPDPVLNEKRGSTYAAPEANAYLSYTNTNQIEHASFWYYLTRPKQLAQAEKDTHVRSATINHRLPLPPGPGAPLLSTRKLALYFHFHAPIVIIPQQVTSIKRYSHEMFSSRKYASRKFSDIILNAVSKWANWDPSITIEAGDYGQIDKRTGQFEREGNIYRDPEVAHIASKFPPLRGPQVNTLEIHSMDVRGITVSPDVHANLFGMAQPAIGGQWQFTRSRGALLLLYKSYLTAVPNELLIQLKSSGWAKGKCVVTRVQACCAYFLYLSDKSGEVISITLQADVPIPVTPGVTPGAAINAGWRFSGASGVVQEAFHDEPVFVPLYQLEEIAIKGRWGRRSPSFDEGEDGSNNNTGWVPIEAPWSALDDDGQELSEEHPVTSDSDEW